MIFQSFFKKNFHFDLSLWSAPLPAAPTGIIILLYYCINLFLPLCFESIELKLLITSWSALLPVGGLLYFSGNGISRICAFHKLPSGSAVKTAGALFLALFLSFISHYWSCLFFKYIGWMVREKQPLTESLSGASSLQIHLIALTVILLAPLGEEIVFRRFLYGILLPAGKVKALLLTSFLFSIGHFYPVGTAGLFFLALILQLLYLNTKNLWCPILVHMMFNALSFVSVLAGKG